MGGLSLALLVGLAALAGIGVTFSTALARRASGPAAGIVAAAPVTPSAAVLVFGAYSSAPWDVLLEGTASVVAVIVVLAGVAMMAHRQYRVPVWIAIVVLVPPLGWSVRMALPLSWQLVAVPVVAVGAGWAIGRLRYGSQRRAGARLSVIQRFSLGAFAVLLVAAVAEFFPSAAGLVALFPVLFTAALAVAQLDGGPDHSWIVARGGVAGSIGVMAFAVAGAGVYALLPGRVVPLLFAWFAFFAAAGAWTRAARGWGDMRAKKGFASPRYRAQKVRRRRRPQYVLAMRRRHTCVAGRTCPAKETMR